MSDVRKCPTCGGKAKYREKDGNVTYTKVEDEVVYDDNRVIEFN